MKICSVTLVSAVIFSLAVPAFAGGVQSNPGAPQAPIHSNGIGVYTSKITHDGTEISGQAQAGLEAGMVHYTLNVVRHQDTCGCTTPPPNGNFPGIGNGVGGTPPGQGNRTTGNFPGGPGTFPGNSQSFNLR